MRPNHRSSPKRATAGGRSAEYSTSSSTGRSGDPSFDSHDSDRKRAQLQTAASRLRSVTVALILILASIDIAFGIVLRTHYRRLMEVGFISAENGAVIVETVIMLSYWASIPTSMLLDGILLPSHGLAGTVLIGVLCLGVLCTTTYPASDDEPGASERISIGTMTSLSFVLFGLSFGTASYIMCIVLANVREKALRIQRTIELSLMHGIVDEPMTNSDGASRRVEEWVAHDALPPGQRGAAASANAGSSASGGDVQSRRATATVIRQGLLERAVWFADGPVSLFVFTTVTSVFCVALLALMFRESVSVFQAVAAAAFAGATALLVLSAIAKSLPKTLSALPTIDELLAFQQSELDATAKRKKKGAARGRPAKRGGRDAPPEVLPPPPHVDPVYSGTAAFQVLWRRFVGESESSLVEVYGDHPVRDATNLLRVSKYALPVLFQVIASASLAASMEGIAVKTMDTSSLARNITPEFVIHLCRAAGAAAAIGCVYVASRVRTRGLVGGPDDSDAGSGTAESRREIAQLTKSPRTVATWGYFVTASAAVATILCYDVSGNVFAGHTPWLLAPFAGLIGVGTALTFAANAALLWSSIAPSLRVFSLALLWTALGFGPIGGRWVPWSAESSAAANRAITGHIVAAVVISMIAVALQLVLLRRHRGQIVDEGALIGRDITPDWGEEGFVLAGRLRPGSSFAESPTSNTKLKRQGRRSGGSPGRGGSGADGYGATEML